MSEKHTYSHFIDDFSRPIGNSFWSKRYAFKSSKVYWAYRLSEKERINKLDFEESFTGQFIKYGFTIYKSHFINKLNDIGFYWSIDKEFKPTLNWFGISIYSPDRIFVKGEKKIIMSLQGIVTPYNPKHEELFESKSIKYIKICEGENIIYETWTGELPSKELINQFLTNQNPTNNE